MSSHGSPDSRALTKFLPVTVSIVRMEDVPAGLFQLLTDIIHDAPVHIVQLALGCRAPDEGRDRFHEQSEVLFTVSKSFFRPPLIIDVGTNRTIGRCGLDRPGGDRRGHGPSGRRHRSASSDEQVQRLSECATPQPLVDHHLLLVRVNEEVETVEAPQFLNGGPVKSSKRLLAYSCWPAELATAIIPGTLSTI